MEQTITLELEECKKLLLANWELLSDKTKASLKLIGIGEQAK